MSEDVKDTTVVIAIIEEALANADSVSKFYVIQMMKDRISAIRLFGKIQTYPPEGRYDGPTDDADENVHRGAKKVYREIIRSPKFRNKFVIKGTLIYRRSPDDPDLADVEDEEPSPISAEPTTVGEYFCRQAIGSLVITGQQKKKWGMVVRKDSLARLVPSPCVANATKGAPLTVLKSRNDLVKAGVLRKDKGCLRFTRDYTFNSVSGAAQVIMGTTADGWKEWKDSNGKNLKQLYG